MHTDCTSVTAHLLITFAFGTLQNAAKIRYPRQEAGSSSGLFQVIMEDIFLKCVRGFFLLLELCLISQFSYMLYVVVDSACRFLVSASSNRGLHGDSTRTVFVHDIKRAE